MGIDYSSIDPGLKEELKLGMLNVIVQELGIMASSAGTEKDQQDYNAIGRCVYVDVEMMASSIKISYGVDKEKLPKRMLEDNAPLVDLVELNLDRKVPFFAESQINDRLESSSIQNAIAEAVVPDVLNRIGGSFQ